MSGSFKKIRNEQRLTYKEAIILKESLIKKYNGNFINNPSVTIDNRKFINPNVVDDLIKKLTR